MQNLTEKTLGLLFTRNMSLRKWDTLGMLNREIAVYQALAKDVRSLYLFTYGTKSDLQYGTLFPENVHIIPRPWYIPGALYSLVLPFVHRSTVRLLSFIKTNQMDGAWTAVIAKKLYSTTLVVRCGYEWLQFIQTAHRGFIKKRFAQCVERWVYASADTIIITSQGAKNFIVEHFLVDPERIVVIPNYVNTDFFSPKASERERGRIVFVGRLEEQKNIPSLIEALKGLPAHLVCIGEGSLRGQLEQLAEDAGVRVSFLGALPQKEIIEEMNRSEIFALPSLYEGHPKTLLEAMSCGLPCIGSNVPGINDTITDGYDGIICESGVKSLHDSLLLLLTDEALRERISTNARKTAVETYSLAVVLEKERAVYTSL